MKHLAVLIALIVSTAGLAAAAPAATSPKRHPAAAHYLRIRLRALHAQVHVLRAERNALRAELARVTAERTTAKARAIPTPLTTAVEQVRREVEWAQGSVTAPLGGQLVSEAAMDYVAGHVSTGAYGYLEMIFDEGPGGPELPSYYEGVNRILASQTGICVHAERAFARIVEALGFEVRDAGFDYTDADGQPDSHAADEVYYGGGWHFFDPTFGQFWTDASGNVLSIADVRAGGGTVHRDDALFTNVVQDAASPGGSDAWFELAPSTVVVTVARRKH